MNGYTAITASNILNSRGQLLPNGYIWFLPVSPTTLQPTSFQPEGGAVLPGIPIGFLIVNGAITTDLNGNPAELADTTLTTPLNLGYRVTVTDAGGTEVPTSGFFFVQPSGATWSLDAFAQTQLELPIGPTGQGLQNEQNSSADATLASVAIAAPGSALSVGANRAVVATALPQPYTAYYAFGDSITHGAQADSYDASYVGLLQAALGLPVDISTDLAISGDQAADVAKRQMLGFVTTNAAQNPLYTVAIGTNDANIKGAGAYEAVFKLCLNACVSWLASSATDRLTGGQLVAQLGAMPAGWSDDGTYNRGNYPVVAIATSTAGAVASFPVTVHGGETVAVWYRVVDGATGQFVYSVNGAPAVRVNSFTTPAIATQNGTTDSVGVAFIPGLGEGSHTVTITAEGFTSIVAVGTSPFQPNFMGPKVFVGGVIRQFGDAKAADTAAYDGDVREVVSSLATMGFPAQFVDQRSYNFSTGPEMYDGGAGAVGVLHPSDLGHANMFRGWAQAIQPFPKSVSSSVSSGSAAGAVTATYASANYTLQGTDSVLYTLAAGLTITIPVAFPTAAPVAIVSFTGSCTLVAASGANIDGLSQLVVAANSTVLIASSGNGYWHVLQQSAGQATVVSANYTVTETDRVIYPIASGVTITLPGGIPHSAPMTLKGVGCGCTVAMGSGETLDGATTSVLLNPGEVLTVSSSGSGAWHTLARYGAFAQNSAPTVTVGAAAGGSGYVTGLQGTNERGLAAVKPGSGATAGVLLTVAFGESPAPLLYGPTAVLLQPGNADAAVLQTYVSSITSAGFSICSANAPAAGTVPNWLYLVR